MTLALSIYHDSEPSTACPSLLCEVWWLTNTIVPCWVSFLALSSPCTFRLICVLHLYYVYTSHPYTTVD